MQTAVSTFTPLYSLYTSNYLIVPCKEDFQLFDYIPLWHQPENNKRKHIIKKKNREVILPKFQKKKRKHHTEVCRCSSLNKALNYFRNSKLRLSSHSNPPTHPSNINPVNAVKKKEKKSNTSWITAVRLLVTLLLAMVWRAVLSSRPVFKNSSNLSSSFTTIL